MLIDHYVAFVAASVLIIIVPGPTNLVVVSTALKDGMRYSAWTVYGAALSHLSFCIAATIGLAAIIAISSDIFETLRWLGAVYLIGLGLWQWVKRSGTTLDPVQDGKASALSLLLQGFFVNSANPKALLFYGAFFPPFVNTSHPILPQLVVLSLTFVTLFLIVAFGHAFAADRVRQLFFSSGYQHVQNKISGALMLVAGALLAMSSMDGKRS